MKRSRSYLSDDELDAHDRHLSSATLSPAELEHDHDYYFVDGSCVIRVENTLFNLHRTILSKDGSAFNTLLSLPQGNVPAEGETDENPIVLLGDTVEEFRDLLWAFYSLPHELMVVHTERANLSQLINVALKANKYCFKSLETWSLDAIHDFVSRKPSPVLACLPSSNAKSAPPEAVAICGAQITRLVRLAQLCGHERLLATMIGLLRTLMTASLRFAYLAITLADELDLRTLRGAAYLEVLQKSGGVVVASAQAGEVPGTTDKDGRLLVTQMQQLRLLAGYFQLTSAWERLRVRPPAFEHASSCGATWHQHGCTQSWLEFWKEKSKGDAVLGLGLADALGRLRAIQKEFDRWGSATYMHHDCRQAARKILQDQIKQIEDELPDYFSGNGVMM
jgi:hypothetical protein